MDKLNCYSDSDSSPPHSKFKEVETSPIGDVVNGEPMETDADNQSSQPNKYELIKHSSTPMGSDPIKRSPTPMDSEPIKHSSTPMGSDPIKRSPTPMDSEPIKHSSTPIGSDPIKRSPTPMDSTPIKHSPTPMDNDPIKRSPTPMDSEPSKRSPSPMDSEPIKHSQTTPESGLTKPKLALESNDFTSSDNSFLDSSPALSPQHEMVKQALSDPNEEPKTLDNISTSPLPKLDSSLPLLSKREKKFDSPYHHKAEFLEDSRGIDDDYSEDPYQEPESGKHEKASNGGSKHPRSPSPLPSKTKPASRTNSKPFIFPGSRRPAMTRDELKQCSSVLRALKRHPDSGPFLQPVDIKKLRIPDYPDIIKAPMDLDTAEKKLGVCAYEVVDEFFADIQRIFDNCYIYNGHDAPVSCFAKRLQARFEELKANFSRVSEILEQESALPSAQKGYLPRPPKPKSKQASRKTSQAHIHSTNSPAGRYSPMPARFGDEMPEHHKKFCTAVLKELFKKLHLSYSAPFLEPVDWEVLNLPDYPHIVKHPMDLSTVKKKFQTGDYSSALEFESDIRLIFQNCFKYNPPSGQVHMMGMKLKSVFESKWAQRPSDINVANDGLSSGSSDASPPKPARQAPRKLANSPRVEPKQETRGRKRKDSSLSQDTTRLPVKLLKPKGRGRKAQGITYSQKKELSEAINRLSGAMLNVVVDLIHRSMPELGSSQKEIEVDIDALDNTTLSKLYSYVMSEPSTIARQDVEPRRPREDTGSKVPRHSDYPQDMPKKRPALTSSSSSTSSGSDSDSGSSALPKSSKTSRPPKSNLSAKKSTQSAKLSSAKPRENTEPKPRESVDRQLPTKKTETPQRISKLRETVDPSIKARRLSAVADAAAKSRPRPRLISPPPKAPSPIQDRSKGQANLPRVGSRPLTTDVSRANIQANLRAERDRLEARKNRTTQDAQHPAMRCEKKQNEEDTRSLAQRNEEEARRVIQLKRSREEAAFAMAQEDKRARLAIGANRKDLLYQNRLMRHYEDKMAREIRLEQEEARTASMRKPPTSSASPSPATNGQQRHQLEDGEIEEGELFE